MEGKKTTKAKVKKGVALSAAAAAAAFVIGFGVHTHIETRDSANFLENIGHVPAEVHSTPHSAHVAKYSKMYNVNPLMLEAAVNYVAMNSTKLNLGPTAKYRDNPEQLTMSIAKRMHDAVEIHGENYPVVLADVFAGNNAVERSKRAGITGNYVDFRQMEPRHAKKVADTLALSGYYAKQRQRKMNPRWQR